MTEYAPYQGSAFAPPPGHLGPAGLLRVRAVLAIIALGLIGAEALVATGMLAYTYRALSGADRMDGTMLAIIDYLDGPRTAVVLLLLVFSGTAFIVWLHRARTNLDGPADWELNWKRGWTIGGWFVPLANFVIPQLVVSEIDRVSERRANEAEGRPYRRRRGILMLWIVLWTLFQLQERTTTAALDRLAAEPSVLLAMVGSLIEVAAVASAILLVLRITANQERLMAHAAQPGPGAYPVADSEPPGGK